MCAFYLQVPLGVIKKNENKIDEMCTILSDLHHYIPTETTIFHLPLPSGNTKLLQSEIFHRVLLGGDKLTVARARSGCSAQADHGSSEQRLSGLLPVTEDWHVKMCFLKVFVLIKAINIRPHILKRIFMLVF